MTGIRPASTRSSTDSGRTLATSPTRPRSTSSPSTTVLVRWAVNRPASSPERPTASGPCSLMSPTSSRCTWPTSTIRTTSMASGVVTRRPPLNSECDPEPVEHGGDLRTAAVHDDGLEAGEAQERDVLGEGALEGVVGHRVAAVLHHHDLPVVALQPGQRGGEYGGLGGLDGRPDSSSMVMRSTRCSRGRRRGSGRWSRSWPGARRT